MIPMSAIAVKSARDLKPGDVGFYFEADAVPFLVGPIQNGVVCAALFSADLPRVLETQKLFGPALVIPGAEIEIDPRSARKASFGSVRECLVFAGPNRYLEVEYQMDVYQLAIGSVDEAAEGARVAFDRWRIVLRHEGTEYDILRRAPAPG